jgi:hypothetical protein
MKKDQPLYPQEITLAVHTFGFLLTRRERHTGVLGADLIKRITDLACAQDTPIQDAIRLLSLYENLKIIPDKWGAYFYRYGKRALAVLDLKFPENKALSDLLCYAVTCNGGRFKTFAFESDFTQFLTDTGLSLGERYEDRRGIVALDGQFAVNTSVKPETFTEMQESGLFRSSLWFDDGGNPALVDERFPDYGNVIHYLSPFYREKVV